VRFCAKTIRTTSNLYSVGEEYFFCSVGLPSTASHPAGISKGSSCFLVSAGLGLVFPYHR